MGLRATLHCITRDKKSKNDFKISTLLLGLWFWLGPKLAKMVKHIVAAIRIHINAIVEYWIWGAKKWPEVPHTAQEGDGKRGWKAK